MVGGCLWGVGRSKATGKFGDIRVAEARFGAGSNVAWKGMTFDLISRAASFMSVILIILFVFFLGL